MGRDRHRARRGGALAGRDASSSTTSRSPTWPRCCCLAWRRLSRIVVLIALASVVLGADRRLGRHAAAGRQSCSAGGAIPRRLSGQPVVPDRGVGDRRAQARSEYLAEPADDPRHPMVHFVQCRCRRLGDTGRVARGRRQFPCPRLAVVAAHRAARGAAVLRHRRHHRLRRIVECQHRRRGRELGQRAPRSAGPRRLYCASKPRPAISTASCSASR